jgi:hypothetical protein
VLWFVPSANATVDHSGTAQTVRLEQNRNTSASQSLALADTGSVDTTPYLVGGSAFLGIGAALVAYAMRRSVSGGAAF